MTAKVIPYGAITLTACANVSAEKIQNTVKLGTADIEVICHGDVPKSIEAIVGVSSIFDHTFDSEDINLTLNDNNHLIGRVELETPEAIGILMLMNDNQKYAVGYVGLSQSEPLIIDVTFQDGEVSSIVRSNDNGVNANPFMTPDKDDDTLLTDVAYRIASPGTWELPGRPHFNCNVFNNSSMATEKLDSLRSYIMECALDGREIPPALDKWFETHLNSMIYGNYYLRYRDNFDTCGNTLPLEFFRFLNNIDFNQLLTHNPIAGPNYILRKMLESPDLELSPIGETPVDQWESTVRGKLGRVMDNVPQLLLDMLSATSYDEQINDNIPLTPIQIENVKAGYKDDLGKLVLRRNEALVQALGSDVAKEDVSDREFVLQSYIDEKFPGQPVVVDAWNTWCMPCMEAHKKVAPLRELEQSRGVAFLYVSDVTSPEAQWERKVPEIGGYHVRISEDSRDEMGKTYGLTAFPSYLFFDKSHKLTRVVTAYPGNNDFLQYISEINN